MVLSDVLLDRQGQVLLPQGAVLTATMIALLPRHGIDRLPVLRSISEGEVRAADRRSSRHRPGSPNCSATST